MYTLLEKHSVSKSTPLEVELLIRPVTIEEVEKIVQELFCEAQDDFTGKFYQVFKDQ